MSSTIGKIVNIEGSYSVKSIDGSTRDLKDGDTIYKNDTIVGSDENSRIDNLIVSLDNGDDIIVLGDEAQTFDASIYEKQSFEKEEVLTQKDSIQQLVEKYGEESIDDLETAAGDEAGGAQSTEGGEAEFADANDASADINAQTRGKDAVSDAQGGNDGNDGNAGEEARRAIDIDNETVLVEDAVVVSEDGTISIDVLANDTDEDGNKSPVTSISQGENGTVVINDNGTVQYTPNENFNGKDTFTYTNAQGNTETVTVTVNPVNDAPVIESTQTISMTEDSLDGYTGYGETWSGDVYSVITQAEMLSYLNITDIDSDTFSVSLAHTTAGWGGDVATDSIFSNTTANVNDETVIQVTQGFLDNYPQIDAQIGDFYFDNVEFDKLGEGDSANISFGVIVNDGELDSAEKTVNITVTGSDDLSVTFSDTATVDEDGTVVIDVLANDTDIDSAVSVVDSVTQGENGTVVINDNGTVQYTPNENFNGNDIFTYTNAQGNTETVTVTVNPVNDAPDAQNDGDVGAQNGLEVTGLFYAGSDVNILDSIDDPLMTTSDHYYFDHHSLGVTGYNYMGDASDTRNEQGNSDWFVEHGINISELRGGTIVFSDGTTGDIKTASNGVKRDYDADGTDDYTESSYIYYNTDTTPITTNEDTPITLDVLANDTDIDGDTLTITDVQTSSKTHGTVEIVGKTVFADGFDNADAWSEINFNGRDAGNWEVENGQLAEQSNAAKGIMSHDMGSDADSTAYSVAVDIDANIGDTYNNGVGIVFGFVDSDNYYKAVWKDYSVSYDTDGRYPTPDSHKDFNLVKVENGVETILDTVDRAELPNNFNMIVDVDENGITVSVDGQDMLSSTQQPEIGTIGLWTRDNDRGVSYDNVVVRTDEAGQELKFTPDADYNGASTFEYTVSDGNGGTDTATVNVNVAPVTDAPEANDDSMIALDTDTDYGDMVAGADSGVTVTGIYAVGTTLNLLADAPELLTLNDYRAVGDDRGYNYMGEHDFFADNDINIGDMRGGTVTFSDGTVGIIDTASNGIDRASGNDESAYIYYKAYENLTLEDLALQTNDDTPITIDVLANDFDVDGDVLSIVSVDNVTHGTVEIVTVDGKEQVIFTPDTNYDGVATFEYTITDGDTTDSATVNLVVHDVTPPEVPVITNIIDNEGDYSSVTLFGTGEPGATITLMSLSGSTTGGNNTNPDGIDNDLNPTTVVDADGNWTYDISGLENTQENDNEFFKAVQSDVAGNESAESNTVHYWHGTWSNVSTEVEDDFVIMGSGNDNIRVNDDDIDDSVVIDGGEGNDTATLNMDYRDVGVTTDENGHTIVTENTGSSDIDEFRNFETINFNDGSLDVETGGFTYITDLGGDDAGEVVTFRITGDHYDIANEQDVGAGSPQYQIIINGEPYTADNGDSTFTVNANRGQVNEAGIGMDRTVDEFELVTLNVPVGTDIDSISIKFVNDAWDSQDNDGDGIEYEDRNLVVDSLNIGGAVNANGTIDGGSTYEAEDTDVSQYLASNGNDVSGREVMPWSGTMTFFPGGVREVTIEGALVLDGANDYIVSDSSVIQSNDEPYTVSITVTPMENDYGYIISNGGQTRAASGMYITQGVYGGDMSSFQFGLTNADQTFHFVGGDVVEGQATTLTLVYDGNEMSIYQDGNLIGTDSVPTAGRDLDMQDLTIGGPSNVPNSYEYGGEVDNVQVYNKALNSDEISNIQDGSTVDSLELHYDFDSDTPLVDQSGNEHNAIASGDADTELTMLIENDVEFNLGALDNAHDLSTIELGNGNQNISINVDDVLDATDADNTLRIEGDAGDTVSIDTDNDGSGEWKLGDFKTDAETGTSYQEYISNDDPTVTIEVNSEIQVDES